MNGGPATPDTFCTMSVIFYWRPGCGFSAALERGLTRRGVELVKRDIWEDPDAAAFVRSVARGHETVPTVVVGNTPLVNPQLEDVLALLANPAPTAAAS